MNNALKQLLAAVITATALIAAPATNAAKETGPATMVTVYINAHGGSSIASKINEMHKSMEAQGWRFADMEVHSENSDTEGVWITYVK